MNEKAAESVYEFFTSDIIVHRKCLEKENIMGQGVSLKEIVEKMNLKNLTPDVDLAEKCVQVPDINRPALQLSGYFDHFDSNRVQVIGYVDIRILQTLEEDKKIKMYDELLSHKIPCLIFSRALEPDQRTFFGKGRQRQDTPVFVTEKPTSSFYLARTDPLDERKVGAVSFNPRSTGRPVYGVGVLG